MAASEGKDQDLGTPRGGKQGLGGGSEGREQGLGKDRQRREETTLRIERQRLGGLEKKRELLGEHKKQVKEI